MRLAFDGRFVLLLDIPFASERLPRLFAGCDVRIALVAYEDVQSGRVFSRVGLDARLILRGMILLVPDSSVIRSICIALSDKQSLAYFSVGVRCQLCRVHVRLPSVNARLDILLQSSCTNLW